MGQLFFFLFFFLVFLIFSIVSRSRSQKSRRHGFLRLEVGKQDGRKHVVEMADMESG